MSFTTRDKYTSPDFEISRNFEPNANDDVGDAVYIWSGNGDWGKAVSTYDARAIAAALIEAADEFDAMLAEAKRPKLPTKKAAVIRFPGYTPFIKSLSGVDEDHGWVNSGSGVLFTNERVLGMGEFEVLFEGVDD